MANMPHPATVAQLAVCCAVQEQKVSVKPPPGVAPFQKDGDASRDDDDDDDPRSRGQAWARQAPGRNLTLACCAGSGLRQTASPPASEHKLKDDWVKTSCELAVICHSSLSINVVCNDIWHTHVD